jgi:hypothetical protein
MSILVYHNIYNTPAGKYIDAIVNDDNYHLARSKVLSKVFFVNVNRAMGELNDQIIDNFGLDRRASDLFFKRISLLLLVSEYLLTNDRKYKGRIDLLKSEISDLEKTIQDSYTDIRRSFATNNRVLHKWSGRNPRDITVYEYYNDLKDLSKEVEEQKKEALKNKKT